MGRTSWDGDERVGLVPWPLPFIEDDVCFSVLPVLVLVPIMLCCCQHFHNHFIYISHSLSSETFQSYRYGSSFAFYNSWKSFLDKAVALVSLNLCTWVCTVIPVQMLARLCRLKHTDHQSNRHKLSISFFSLFVHSEDLALGT